MSASQLPPALHRPPQAIGVITLALGVALLAAPSRLGRAAHLGDRPALARTIGVMDLVLVPGLLRGRPRWPWMVARAAFNVPVAAAFRTEARRTGHPAARAGFVTMLGLSTMDLLTALRLHRAERSN
jgi:hypothetical protein